MKRWRHRGAPSTAPPIHDLYCAIAGQVSAAPSHVSLARPDPSAIWSCSIPHRKAQTAAMFSCRAAWQRCGPLARRAAYRLPLDGESPVYPEECARLVCVYTICLAVTYGRVHSVPRSVSACITYSKSESLHVQVRWAILTRKAFTQTSLHMCIFSKIPGSVGNNSYQFQNKIIPNAKIK